MEYRESYTTELKKIINTDFIKEVIAFANADGEEIYVAVTIAGVSQTRNTIVANIFYRLELIESYGTGIQRIITANFHAP